VFNDAALKAAAKRIEEDYGERGYFYVSLDPRTEKKAPIANVTLAITEDRRYYVDRIEFSGNAMTRDYVLRREVPLYETDLLNVRRLRLGVRKITQLGYWQVGQDPVVEPLPDSDRVQVELQGVETSRNEIQVGGGVSGIDGAFFTGSYATRNFLGRGEILSAYLQTGSRASRYSLNFTEPWFLGKPWTLGFSLFRRQTEYVDFKRNGRGLSVVLGRLLGPFSRLDFQYGLETVEYLPSSPGYGSPTTTTISSITTAWSRDTRNNYFRPNRGYRLSASLEYAGDFLGGDANFYKPRLDATLFLPGFMRRHYVGLNLSAGWIQPLKGQVVPTFERYYLGGERTLRLFRTRTVGPQRTDVDLDGNGFIDPPEDRNPDGILDANLQPCEDLNGDGVIQSNEIDRGNCLLDPDEDLNGNSLLDTEDLNRNGVLDPGEDLDGDGLLDSEDANGNGSLDLGEDRSDGQFTPFCPADDTNMNGVRDFGEGDFGNCRLDQGEDTNGDGVLGPVYPGGDKFLVLNVEYAIPLTDTVEFALFYDAGNAFDDGVRLQLDGMRVDYGFEMRFFLPVFQAPLRLIYGYIENPRPGEDSSNFIFTIGTTF
jgi:outer membrane protein assembly factor BamA